MSVTVPVSRLGHRPTTLLSGVPDRAAWPSGLGKGLQSPLPQFDSGRRLKCYPRYLAAQDAALLAIWL